MIPHARLSAVALVIAIVGLSVMAANSATAGPVDWVGAWASAEQRPIASSFLGRNWSEEGFNDHSVRQVVRVSTGGSMVRIILSNVHGDTALSLAGGTVGTADADGAVRPDIAGLTFGGRESAVLPVGQRIASDPVSLPTLPLQRLAVTLYFAGPTGPATFHEAGMTTTYRAGGDHRYDASGTAFSETSHSWYYLTGIEVAGGFPPRDAVVAFGDSLTDGISSTPGAENRYPDELAERLAATGRPRGVLNVGINGNRVLNDSPCFGDGATARFERDVLDRARAHTVIFLQGINDIQAHAAPLECFAPHKEVSAEELIDGHRQLIRAAHAHGVQIIGATITPYQGSRFFDTQGETVRDAVNHWIRTSGKYDAVVDFDRVLSDPDHPDQLRAVYNAGDNLHPNDAGLRAMAEAVDLDEI